jgi:cysteinyl-tRNA synthetase
VYGPAHIGNARPAIVFDQLFRTLRQYYGAEKVTYVRNITDVDDKIIAASLSEGRSIADITREATARYHADLEKLNVLPPTFEPKATDNIPQMIGMISGLISKGHAYVVDGEVFFHVPSNPNPGLANHATKGLIAGARVAKDSKKRDFRDFVLWKPAKEGEPSWKSPWGNGRPGWHIECSAMIKRTLGTTIDIHGGGQDLRFPHHDAECAQSHCFNDAPLAHYWLHNGLLTVEGEKMSKSRGNVILLDELFQRYPAESVRYYFLSTHYRSPMVFNWQALNSAHRALDGLYELLHRYDDIELPDELIVPDPMMQKLSFDLNTPRAVSFLHNIATNLERRSEKARYKAQLVASGQILGFFNQTPTQWRTLGVDKDAVEVLIAERQQARSKKDWARADTIRQQLLDMGVTLADGVHGTEWRRT